MFFYPNYTGYDYLVLSTVDMALVVLLAEQGEIAMLALERFERDLALVCTSLFVGGKVIA